MASSKHLHPLTTSHHNRSLSNISATSDACTFHSAQDHPQSSHMEMRPLSSSQTPSSPSKSTPVSSQKLEAIKMSRQDSGYQESSPRTSTSSRHSSHASSSHPSKPKRRSTTESKSSSSRPNAKRGSRSSINAAQIRTSTSGSRPSLSSRHTSPFPRTDIQNIHQPYTFFQFPAPVLADPTPSLDPPESPHPPPPPATTQYWTSDQTRRLEYAAIDAAGRGVRGFFIRLVPDCILPPTSRRTRFCEQGGDDGASDAGSVRRYRLCLPEEKDGGEVGVKERRQGLWRRVTGRAR